MLAIAAVLSVGLFVYIAALWTEFRTRSTAPFHHFLSERFLVANVVAEAGAIESLAARGPAQPYQREMLRICERGTLK